MHAKKQIREKPQNHPDSHSNNETVPSPNTSDSAHHRISGPENIQKVSDAKAGVESKTNRTGMPDNLKSGLENLSGYDLSPVRVRYNSPKPKQIGALAYTQGTDIHIGPGQQKHLPHESWHAVQQMQGRVKPNKKIKGMGLNDNTDLEKEADVMGTRALKEK